MCVPRLIAVIRPHFNHDFLKELLKNAGIDYLFMGGELGGGQAG